jgi:hypothetical protein
VTADSKTLAAVLAALQALSAILYFTSRVRMSFAVGGITPMLVLPAAASSWTGINGGEIVLLVVGVAVIAGAIAGAAGSLSAPGWWIIWSADLVALAAVVYFAFFFRIFSG